MDVPALFLLKQLYLYDRTTFFVTNQFIVTAHFYDVFEVCIKWKLIWKFLMYFKSDKDVGILNNAYVVKEISLAWNQRKVKIQNLKTRY